MAEEAAAGVAADAGALPLDAPVVAGLEEGADPVLGREPEARLVHPREGQRALVPGLEEDARRVQVRRRQVQVRAARRAPVRAGGGRRRHRDRRVGDRWTESLLASTRLEGGIWREDRGRQLRRRPLPRWTGVSLAKNYKIVTTLYGGSYHQQARYPGSDCFSANPTRVGPFPCYRITP